MNIVELELDETLADFEVQDWIDNVFSVQYPDVKARIKKGCNGKCHEKTEWHYVKEKLPEKSDACLYDLKPVNVAVWTPNKTELTVLGTYWHRREGRFLCLDEVYAWREVPEPPEVK